MGVAQFYEGKTIFITGATGFMGKVLVEKLLRSCPGIEKIYILIRPKRGCSLEERLQKFLGETIFEVLKKENPDALEKIIGVKGDVTELNLGLSESDRTMLLEKVNIIFHSAASVRFDDFLEKSIIMNVRGTREIAQLALDSKNLTILVHVSTSYCTGNRYVEEKLYPADVNWKEAIMLAEECDKELLNTLTEKYIYPHQNTYTFAKGLGEHVINDMCAGKIPAVITRPSIVTSALDEPLRGWHDNFNGPMGLMTAGGKGLSRIGLICKNNRINYIPVDIAIKGIILASNNYAKKKNDKNEIEIYNITKSIFNGTQKELLGISKKMCLMTPFPNLIWYPRFAITSCIYDYYIQVLLFHMLPAVIIDLLLKLAGKKTILVKLQRKIFIVNCTLKHFTSENYVFENDKMINMQKNLEDEDEAFRHQLEFNYEEIMTHLIESRVGLSKYVIKESVDPTGQKEIKNLRRFWYADIALKTFIFSFFCWLLFIKLDLITKSLSSLDNYFRNL